MQDFYYKLLSIARQKHGNDTQTIDDIFYYCKNTFEESGHRGMVYSKALKKLIDDLMHDQFCEDKESLYNRIFDILVLETPYSLDSYFQALEWYRPMEEKFYLPRRNTLMKHGVIQALEDLIINDKLDEVFLSMPPRVGKTTLSVFVNTWILGMKSERTNLYSSNSGVLVQAFYSGIHSILEDEYTYAWHKIFPKVKFDSRTMCSAKDTYLDTGRSKRFHSFTGRSIDGSLNGACDCNFLLTADDLVNGIEEALNVQRLRSLWLKVQNDLLTRAKQKAKILWIGTRWSIYDPIGIRLLSSELQTKRVKNIVIPALDENDESNFDYLYNVGYDTKTYRGKRMSFEESDDIASWNAQFQGEPIERSGLLFPMDEFRTYSGTLPDVEPTRKFGFIDVGWGGGDYCVMPIIYQYENELYCPEIICESGNKKISQPRIVDAIIRHQLSSVKVEKNNGGEGYKDDLGRLLSEKNAVNCLLTSAFASNQMAKETKIFENAPNIKEIYFLDPSNRNAEYRKALEQLCSFTIKGKNKHDDVADALAECCSMANEITKKVIFEVFQRFI